MTKPTRIMLGLVAGLLASSTHAALPEVKATLVLIAPGLTLDACLAHRDLLRKIFEETGHKDATVQCSADVP